MIRGTTAQFKFKLPYNKEEILLAEAKFWQSGNDKGLNSDYPLPITRAYKKPDEGEEVGVSPWTWIDDHTLVIRLGQQETLTFSDRYKARVQIRIRTASGAVFASTPQIFSVYSSGWTEPLGDDIDLPESGDEWVVFDGHTIRQEVKHNGR